MWCYYCCLFCTLEQWLLQALLSERGWDFLKDLHLYILGLSCHRFTGVWWLLFPLLFNHQSEKMTVTKFCWLCVYTILTYIYIYTYILSFTDSCITTLKCGLTLKMLQTGIETWLILCQLNILPLSYRHLSVSDRNFYAYRLLEKSFCIYVHAAADNSLLECSMHTHTHISIYIYMRLCVFHIVQISLGKVWIQLFSPQLWINGRTYWALNLD